MGIGDHLTVDLGPKPSDAATLYALFCDAALHSYTWVSPEDVVDLDALAQAEAQRYVEDVLEPGIRVGVNPSARGLAGMRSWFWVEGFSGDVQAPPVSAFGVTVNVRMTVGSITWDFGDGTVEPGDLGRAYPEESTVQHAHQSDGTYTVAVTIELVPEFSVDGGAWTSLPNLSITASVDHDVEQRQAVITDV